MEFGGYVWRETTSSAKSPKFGSDKRIGYPGLPKPAVDKAGNWDTVVDRNTVVPNDVSVEDFSGSSQNQQRFARHDEWA